MKISVLIPTFNCESTIERTLESVKWADQIIIIDSYSTDNTLNIIKSLNFVLIIFIFLILDLIFLNSYPSLRATVLLLFFLLLFY